MITTDCVEAQAYVREALKAKKPLSIGLVGNTATVLPALVKAGFIPDIVTDQTSAHDLMAYWPEGELKQLMKC